MIRLETGNREGVKELVEELLPRGVLRGTCKYCGSQSIVEISFPNRDELTNWLQRKKARCCEPAIKYGDGLAIHNYLWDLSGMPRIRVSADQATMPTNSLTVDK